MTQPNEPPELTDPPELTVVAKWTVAPGNEERVLRLLDAIELASRAEPGCLSFEGFVARTGPATVVLVERYRDARAFQRHRESAHFREIVLEGVVPLLTHRSVTRLVQAPPGPAGTRAEIGGH